MPESCRECEYYHECDEFNACWMLTILRGCIVGVAFQGIRGDCPLKDEE